MALDQNAPLQKKVDTVLGDEQLVRTHQPGAVNKLFEDLHSVKEGETQAFMAALRAKDAHPLVTNVDCVLPRIDVDELFKEGITDIKLTP